MRPITGNALSQGITESVVEEAALTWVDKLGWRAKHGPEIAPGELAAERADFGQVVLRQRLRDALARLNPILLADRNPARLVLLSEEAGMFELTRGNLLDADVEAVVNTVNTESL
jgi:type I restriction enzyme, R subunit